MLSLHFYSWPHILHHKTLNISSLSLGTSDLSSPPCLEYKKLAVVADDNDRTVSSGSVILYQGQAPSEWTTLIGPDPSRYCALIGWDHGVARPALLCHKGTAQGTQSTSCLSLCLYGICDWPYVPHSRYTLHTIFVMFRVHKYAAAVKILMAEQDRNSVLTGVADHD